MIGYVEGYYGWLGNRLFQYCATRALSLRRGVECVFPTDDTNLFLLFPRLGAVPRNGHAPDRIYTERQFHFDPAVLDLPDGTFLSGYFQSERYFADHARTIRAELTEWEGSPFMRPDIPGVVSVHVRRGDYIKLAAHHPPLPVSYYREAMALFPGYDFMFFSDDILWCQQTFGGTPQMHPRVSFSFGRSALEDMALMSRCEHNIIANSSFSWWGAWLNLMPSKKVIAPSEARWFGPAKAGWSTKDLIPEGWTRI